MTKMTGPDCAVMYHLINTSKHTHDSDKDRRERMSHLLRLIRGTSKTQI